MAKPEQTIPGENPELDAAIAAMEELDVVITDEDGKPSKQPIVVEDDDDDETLGEIPGAVVDDEDEPKEGDAPADPNTPADDQDDISKMPPAMQEMYYKMQQQVQEREAEKAEAAKQKKIQEKADAVKKLKEEKATVATEYIRAKQQKAALMKQRQTQAVVEQIVEIDSMMTQLAVANQQIDRDIKEQEKEPAPDETQAFQHPKAKAFGEKHAHWLNDPRYSNMKNDLVNLANQFEQMGYSADDDRVYEAIEANLKQMGHTIPEAPKTQGWTQGGFTPILPDRFGNVGTIPAPSAPTGQPTQPTSNFGGKQTAKQGKWTAAELEMARAMGNDTPEMRAILDKEYQKDRKKK